MKTSLIVLQIMRKYLAEVNNNNVRMVILGLMQMIKQNSFESIVVEVYNPLTNILRKMIYSYKHNKCLLENNAMRSINIVR